MDSIILIGQSNMAGRGFLTEDLEKPSGEIYVMRNGRWVHIFRPINPDRPFSGYNLSEDFAKAYLLDHPDAQLGIVPSADGGSSMDEWKEGGILFDNAVYNTLLAERSSRVVAILWHQGEADCDQKLAESYADRLSSMLKAFRKKTGTEEVPIILGGLGDYLKDCELDEKLKNFGQVNEELKKVCRRLKNVGFADATGLTSNPDRLHFNTASLKEFGKRYYEAYKKTEGFNEKALKGCGGSEEAFLKTKMSTL